MVHEGEKKNKEKRNIAIQVQNIHFLRPVPNTSFPLCSTKCSSAPIHQFPPPPSNHPLLQCPFRSGLKTRLPCSLSTMLTAVANCGNARLRIHRPLCCLRRWTNRVIAWILCELCNLFCQLKCYSLIPILLH